MINLSPSLLVGKKFTEETLQWFSKFNIRVIKPGIMYTQEINPNRWNIVVNKNDEIVDVYKG